MLFCLILYPVLDVSGTAIESTSETILANKQNARVQEFRNILVTMDQEYYPLYRNDNLLIGINLVCLSPQLNPKHLIIGSAIPAFRPGIGNIRF